MPLFGLFKRRESSDSKSAQATLYEGNTTLEVVGESRYQDDIWRIVGGRRSGGVRHPVLAVLRPEPNNKFDPNAIAVQVEGRTIGYLSRDVAARYRPGLIKLMQRSTNGLVVLRGTIVGGSSGPSLGVFLEHNPADFGLEPEAGTKDALGWMANLPHSDTAAIQFLRHLLSTEPNPTNRHYMFNELEARLYRARDAFGSALAEYDDACRLHDSEMDNIRIALITESGSLPFLETYKQASIRHQKANDWAAAMWWAKRGLTVYAADAHKSEWIEDLQKRVARAAGKLESNEGSGSSGD
ncbi:MAG: HIRAN domain-containing protein [Dehalococcoidia bacterium]|nr:HIRAN domain-containing protein [Dehalococcoidia bacterium]MCB9485644.1 HIRAN domain-containing protein [Thermoflexaceae bacterium]